MNDRLRKIKLLLMDCDGVLTDGRLYFSKDGEAMKVFDVRDGQGIVLWHKAGFLSGVVSGRGAAEIIRSRASELGMKYVRAGSKDKVADLLSIAKDEGMEPDEVAFIGDDIGDIGAMEIAGFSAAVGDAVDEVRSVANYIANATGGKGAVREVIDLLLAAKRDVG